MATFRFTVGPWNVHEGNETFGPGNRKSVPFEEKIKKYAEIGIDGIQFHDDDAVPDMNNMTEKQIQKELHAAAVRFEDDIRQGYKLNSNQTFFEYAQYVMELKERTSISGIWKCFQGSMKLSGI